MARSLATRRAGEVIANERTYRFLNRRVIGRRSRRGALHQPAAGHVVGLPEGAADATGRAERPSGAHSSVRKDGALRRRLGLVVEGRADECVPQRAEVVSPSIKTGTGRARTLIRQTDGTNKAALIT